MADGDGESLLAAAQHLDDQLKRFGKLVNEACRGEIGSQKEIERTAAALTEATSAVAEIETRTHAVVRALQNAQLAQQAPIDRLRARAEHLQKRHQQHEALRARFTELGAEAAALAQVVQPIALESPSAVLEIDLAAPMAELQQRLAQARSGARTLMQDARNEKFEEIAREAHSFEQTLGALETKLRETEESIAKLRVQVPS